MGDALFRASRRELLAGSVLAAVPAAGATAQPKGATRAQAGRAEAEAKALHAAQPTPALSLAVARPDGVAWTGAYGKADLELDVAATPAHRFKLGSVSKVLTSTTAARLAARRAVDLDAPISTWLKDLPEPHRQTTLKQLLTHQGGVRHYIGRDADRDAPGGPLDFRLYPTNREILNTFINDPLIGPPGAQVAYSTFGYTLASLVLEAAAGTPFPALVKAEIGETFGLPSLDADDPQALRPMRARGYGPVADYKAGDPLVGEGWANARQTNPAYKWAGGGFVMTPSDLARFGAALLEGPVARISGEERALLFTPLTAANRRSPPLGLGWRVDADPKGRRRWHHAGAQEGGRASLVIYPDLSLSIALASNVATTPGDVLGPSGRLADAFS